MKINNDRKISDILWEAANEYLSEVGSIHLRSGGYGWKNKYSCLAVYDACEEFSVSPYETMNFLEELGVNTDGFYEFNEFDAGEERQGARYLWLMFAYQVALSEGV